MMRATIQLAADVPGPLTPGFKLEELLRYKQLLEEASALQALQVVAKLDSCNTAVRLLKQSLHYEKRELQSVIMAEEEASTQLDKYTSRAGCQGFFLGRRRVQEKISKASDALERYVTQHTEAARRVQDSEAALQKAQDEQAVWEGKVAELRSLESERATLVAGMFTRPPWTGDAVLAPMLHSAATLRSQAAAAQQSAANYAAAEEQVRGALQLCHEAVELLQRGGWLGSFEVDADFASAAGDPFLGKKGVERRNGGEVAQMLEIQHAQERVQQAAQQIELARAVLPSLPCIQEAAVQDCKTGPFADILAGNCYSEAIVAQQVAESMRRVGALMQQAEQCRRWCGEKQDVLEAQRAAHTAAAAAKDAEVEAFKRQKLHDALDRMAWNSVMEKGSKTPNKSRAGREQESQQERAAGVVGGKENSPSPAAHLGKGSNCKPGTRALQARSALSAM